jgi:hypothetical protein
MSNTFIIDNEIIQIYSMSPEHIATIITEDIRINNGMLFEAGNWSEFWGLLERASDLIKMTDQIHVSDENFNEIKNKIIALNVKIINRFPDMKSPVRKFLTNFNKELRLRWIPASINMKRLEHELGVPEEQTDEFAKGQTAKVESTTTIRQIVGLYLDLKSTVKNFIDELDIVSQRRLSLFILAIEKVIKALSMVTQSTPTSPAPSVPAKSSVKTWRDVDVLPIPNSGQDKTRIIDPVMAARVKSLSTK